MSEELFAGSRRPGPAAELSTDVSDEDGLASVEDLEAVEDILVAGASSDVKVVAEGVIELETLVDVTSVVALKVLAVAAVVTAPFSTLKVSVVGSTESPRYSYVWPKGFGASQVSASIVEALELLAPVP